MYNLFVLIVLSLLSSLSLSFLDSVLLFVFNLRGGRHCRSAQLSSRLARLISARVESSPYRISQFCKIQLRCVAFSFSVSVCSMGERMCTGHGEHGASVMVGIGFSLCPRIHELFSLSSFPSVPQMRTRKTIKTYDV